MFGWLQYMMWVSMSHYFYCFLQLQEAFSKGALKPGMYVMVNKPKKFINNVVSEMTSTNLKGETSNMTWHLITHYHMCFQCRMVWSSALLTSEETSPGWRGWTWPTCRLKTLSPRLKEKSQVRLTETSMQRMIFRGRCSCECLSPAAVNNLYYLKSILATVLSWTRSLI